jgi:hypothetical protein
VELLDTEPESRTVTLGSGQTFYLRLAYSTDAPVHIWARPYFAGREVNAGSNPSRVYEGAGEALAWFFFIGDAGQRVDEIRISAGDGTTAGTQELLRVPVSIGAGVQRAPAAAEPAWLAVVVLRIVLGTWLDPTSHNLWPFEILYASVVSLALIGALALGRRLLRA